MKSLAACLVFMVFVFVWSNTSSQDLGGCGTNVLCASVKDNDPTENNGQKNRKSKPF
jgi:hypothetical protein